MDPTNKHINVMVLSVKVVKEGMTFNNRIFQVFNLKIQILQMKEKSIKNWKNKQNLPEKIFHVFRV